MAGAGNVGPQATMQALAAAPAPGGTGPGGVNALRGSPSPAPPTQPAAGRTSGGDKGVVSSELSMPDIGKIPVPGFDINGHGDTRIYGEGAKKTKKDYQQAAIDAGFDVFDEGGNLATLPINEGGIIDPAFLAAIGLGNNPGLSAKMSELPDLFKQYQTAYAAENTTAAKQAQAKIIGNLKAAKQGGLKVDPEGLFNFYASGEGAGTWAPAPTDPTQSPPGIENGTIGEDGSVNLGTIDLDAAKAGLPDQLLKWINENPESGKAILDWIASLQARDDRQLGIDAYQQYGEHLENDPVRNAMEEWVSGGPRYSMSPEIVDAMKSKDRSLAGRQAAEAERILREQAAGRGQPTGVNAGELLRTRADIFGRMSERLTDTDIKAAQQKAQDEQVYWNELLGGNAALSGPLASYYGSLASLIAGTPGLANTGNPLTGMMEDPDDDAAMGAADWTAILASLGGAGLQAAF